MKKTKSCHTLEETKETEYCTAMRDTALGPGPEKGPGGGPQTLQKLSGFGNCTMGA